MRLWMKLNQVKCWKKYTNNWFRSQERLQLYINLCRGLHELQVLFMNFSPILHYLYHNLFILVNYITFFYNFIYDNNLYLSPFRFSLKTKSFNHFVELLLFSCDQGRGKLMVIDIIVLSCDGRIQKGYVSASWLKWHRLCSDDIFSFSMQIQYRACYF